MKNIQQLQLWIQILREQVNDSTTLNLIRKYLKAGVLEKKDWKELRYTRYADDVLIFMKIRIGMMKQFMEEFGEWLIQKKWNACSKFHQIVYE